MNAIVVGYVARPEGLEAVKEALAEAERRQARVVVVASVHHQEPEAKQRDFVDVKNLLIAARGEHELRILGGIDPSEQVLATAEELSAQLIVIGIRHRTAVGKLIMGSNAQNILLDATCPVLAVKAIRR